MFDTLLAAVVIAAAAASPSPAPTSTPAPQNACSGPSSLLAMLNRPTIGFSTCSVDRGALVLEEGYQVQQSAGQSLVQYQGFERFGIAPNLEVDAVGPVYNRLLGPEVATNGFSDTGIGAKYQLPMRGAVNAAFDALYTIPNGAPAFTLGSSAETINLDVGTALSSTTGVAATLAYTRTAKSAAFMPSVVMTQQLWANSQFYLEYVADSNIGNGLGGRAFLDYGLQQLIGPNLELDVEQGRTFTGNAEKSFQYFGAGLGLRVPLR